MHVPEARYAQVGEAAIAYQVFGQGPPDLVVTPGFVSHLDLHWTMPSYTRFFEACPPRLLEGPSWTHGRRFPQWEAKAMVLRRAFSAWRESSRVCWTTTGRSDSTTKA